VGEGGGGGGGGGKGGEIRGRMPLKVMLEGVGV